MGSAADAAFGAAGLAVSLSVYAYYTLWLLVTPLLPEEHALLRYFPERIYAITVPLGVGLLLLAVLLTVVAVSRLAGWKKKKKKKE